MRQIFILYGQHRVELDEPLLSPDAPKTSPDRAHVVGHVSPAPVVAARAAMVALTTNVLCGPGKAGGSGRGPGGSGGGGGGPRIGTGTGQT